MTHGCDRRAQKQDQVTGHTVIKTHGSHPAVRTE